MLYNIVLVSAIYQHESAIGIYERKESEVAQLCPTLCDPMDRSPPGSSAHGILQTRILTNQNF